MNNEKSIPFQSSTALFQAAIEKIELFAKEDISDLDVKEDGKFIVAPSPLDGFIGRARRFLTAVFSDQIRQEQEKKLHLLKEEILSARDIIQSHLALIEKLKQGDSSQQKLAHWALETIKNYNAAVTQVDEKPSWSSRYAVYLKSQLLLDEEIKGKQIQLPLTVSIKYDSHPAQKTLKELSEMFLNVAEKKTTATSSSLAPTHKKALQVMIDAFRMKAIRMVQAHLSQQNFVGDILKLIKQTPIEIKDEPENEVSMQQILEVSPGSTIILTGSFERCSAESKFMSIPIFKKDSFRLTSQSVQTGFPYPSQHTSWALAHSLIDASPLRSEQVPLFTQLEQRKRLVAQALLFDPAMISKARQLAILQKEVLDSHSSLFLDLHRELSETFMKEAGATEQTEDILNSFYLYVKSTLSPFEILMQMQNQFIYLNLICPAKKLQEEWLESDSSLLRTGSYQEKFQAAVRLIKDEVHCTKLANHPISDQYFREMKRVIRPAMQAIILQYMSEKIGFAPPMLNDFEQKMQICAFQQLLTFLEIMEQERLEESRDVIKHQLIEKFQADIVIFKTENVNQLTGLAADLANELESYFNLRFYATHRK